MVRACAYQSQDTRAYLGVSVPHAPHTLSTEVLTFHFALSLRQCVPSYSDSCGFAIDWLDVQVLRSCSRSYKRKVKGPSFKNALGHTLKVDDDSLYVQLCGRVSGLTFIVTRGNSTFCSYVT